MVSQKKSWATDQGVNYCQGISRINHFTISFFPGSNSCFPYLGVIHILDDMPIPSNINFNTRKYLYGLNSTKLVALMDECGLEHYLETGSNDDAQKYTILAPANEDIKDDAIPDSIKKNWLTYHVMGGSYSPDLLTDGALIKSEFVSPRLGDAPQRIPVFVETEAPVKAAGKSIRFGHSRVLSDPGNEITNRFIYTHKYTSMND